MLKAGSTVKVIHPITTGFCNTDYICKSMLLFSLFLLSVQYLECSLFVAWKTDVQRLWRFKKFTLVEKIRSRCLHWFLRHLCAITSYNYRCSHSSIKYRSQLLLGYYFHAWSGNCDGANYISVTVMADSKDRMKLTNLGGQSRNLGGMFLSDGRQWPAHRYTLITHSDREGANQGWI